MESALKGLKILDFTHVYQGPVGTQILGDYGADIIKVERPRVGDWSRLWGPFVKGVSLPFANLNRNKRSLSINLKSEKGKEIIGKLVREADILVHNFRKGVMEKNGLGYDDVISVNPGLIYAWSSGWGDSGPYADRGRAGHDMMARAEGAWFIQNEDGKPPIPGGVSIDYCAGLNLMNAILMALYHREKTGQGQFVSTDLLSVAFHAHAWEGATELNSEKIDAPAAIGGTEAAIRNAFATSNGFIEISPVFSDNALRDISVALGMDDLSQDPRFETESLQLENQKELNQVLSDAFRTKSTDTWMEELEPKGVLCARVNRFKDTESDPQLLANNMVVEMDLAEAGRLKMLGTPVRLHGTPPSLRRPPASLGQHSREIALELGYSEDEIQTFLTDGILEASGDGASVKVKP